MAKPLALLALAMVQGQSAPDAGTLSEAVIRFIIYPTHARAVAQYLIERSGEPLLFDAQRTPGQLVVIKQATGPGFGLGIEQQLENRRLSAPASEPGPMAFRVIYDVSGDLTHMPVFVPGARIEPGATRLRLEIVGLPDDVRLTRGSPAFEAAEGLWFAEPSGLPAIVEVPHPQERSRTGVRTAIAVTLLFALLLVALAQLRRSLERRSAR